MNQLIDIAFSGFASFVGVMLLLCLLLISIEICLQHFLNAMTKAFDSWMRMLCVRKHGWPPYPMDNWTSRSTSNQ